MAVRGGLQAALPEGGGARALHLWHPTRTDLVARGGFAEVGAAGIGATVKVIDAASRTVYSGPPL